MDFFGFDALGEVPNLDRGVKRAHSEEILIEGDIDDSEGMALEANGLVLRGGLALPKRDSLVEKADCTEVRGPVSRGGGLTEIAGVEDADFGLE